MQSNKNSHSLLVEMKNDTGTLEDNCFFFSKLNIILQNSPTIAHPGIYQIGLKYVHEKTFTWMLIVALHIITKPRK